MTDWMLTEIPTPIIDIDPATTRAAALTICAHTNTTTEARHIMQMPGMVEYTRTNPRHELKYGMRATTVPPEYPVSDRTPEAVNRPVRDGAS